MRASMVWLVVGAAACVPRLESSGLGGGEWFAPTNDWPMSEPPDDLSGVGFFEGQVVPDFRLADQFGNEVSLWQFYGQVVLIDVSTMWCSPCQQIAVHTEETYLDYVDRDFMYLTILHENVHNEPPSQTDLNQWVDSFGITSPVLADGQQLTAGAVTQGQYPALLVVDRKMKVAERIKVALDEEIRDAIERAL